MKDSPSIKLNLPASKSINNRLLILQHLYPDRIKLKNTSSAEDTIVLKELLEQEYKGILDCKMAGTTLRFLTAYFSIQEAKTVTLTGHPRLLERPVDPLVETLKLLGAQIEYLDKQGYPPLRISGKKLKSIEVEINADISSQFITALALIAPKLEKGLKLYFRGELVSSPYVSMTLQILKSLNIKYDYNLEHLHIKHKSDIPKREYTIENDWSAASYFIAACALKPVQNLSLSGLSRNSWQGDSAILNFTRSFGLNFSWNENCLIVDSNPIKPKMMEALMADFPDLVPTLVVLCSILKVPFRFYGVYHLKIKESDRIEALRTELEKFNVRTKFDGECLKSVDFGEMPEKARVITHNDHRMAMAFSLYRFKCEVSFDNEEVVSKSFP